MAHRTGGPIAPLVLSSDECAYLEGQVGRLRVARPLTTAAGQLPTPIFRVRFLRQLHARVSMIVWKGFAPLSLAVSTVVRTSASVFAAHMAR